jgi:hypothetical protein
VSCPRPHVCTISDLNLGYLNAAILQLLRIGGLVNNGRIDGGVIISEKPDLFDFIAARLPRIS